MNTETVTISGRTFTTEDREFFATSRSNYAASRMWGVKDAEVYAMLSTSRSHKMVGFFQITDGAMVEWTQR